MRDIEAPSSVFDLLGKENCQFYYGEAGEADRLGEFDQVRPGIIRRKLDRFLDLVLRMIIRKLDCWGFQGCPSHVGPCLRGGGSMFVGQGHIHYSSSLGATVVSAVSALIGVEFVAASCTLFAVCTSVLASDHWSISTCSAACTSHCRCLCLRGLTSYP